MSRSFMLAGLALTLGLGVTVAADWPSWRGPKRDGVSTETGLLKEWPDGGPKMLWEVKGLGNGLSSLAISGGKIFTLGQRKGGSHLIALEQATGKELWSTPIAAKGSGGGANATPTVDGDRVYALTQQGAILCARTADGEPVWRKEMGKDLDGEMMSGWGYSESFLIDGDKLICTPGSKTAIAALDKKTGEVLWKSDIPDNGGAGYASIVISEAAGVKQYITLFGRCIASVAAKDGKLLWRYDRVANGTANIPTPIVRGDHVFCSTGYGTGAALLKLEKKGDGVAVKEVKFLKGGEFQNHHGGMVLVGDYVYAGHGHNDGVPICIDFKTGEVQWKQNKRPGAGSAAVVYADGNLYFRNQDGIMTLIEANPKEYKLKGEFTIPHGPERLRNPSDRNSWSHPVIADGKLYLRENDWLMCYDIKAK